MSDDIGFRIVCTDCGCLSIRIEEPLKAVREAIVYCGDCGTPRGTIGALRDLAVQRYSDIVFSMISTASPPKGVAANEPQAGEISKRYAELRRLRQQVEIAEWLTRNRRAVARVSRRNATHAVFRPLHHPRAIVRVDDERERKRPN